ncbi:MAG: hypothetical protein QOE65_169 [Solirubrobacteraceae bacterium]|jgi:hypothetical protein|nr:hypothetical protein [Solirubrobacteraceae bacterium]
MLGKLLAYVGRHHIGLVALAVALGGSAYAAIPARNGTIKACYTTRGGAMRVVDSATRGCRRGQKLLSWNQQGLRGLPGAAGANGTPGTNGRDGTAGRDATPADFAGEPTRLVAAGDVFTPGCGGVARFCSGNFASWANYSEAHPSFAPVGFWRDKANVVRLQGTVARNSPVGGDPSNTMFVLPEGYRPTGTREFTVRLCGGTLNYVDIAASGDVTVGDQTASCVPLDGITFRP